MHVLVVVGDPELGSFFTRALPVLGHQAWRQWRPQIPDALIVDAGPGLLVVRLEGRGRRFLRKPFTLEELQAALGAAERHDGAGR